MFMPGIEQHDEATSSLADPFFETKVIFTRFTLALAALSSPIVGLLHLNQWYGYESYIHAINCFIFAVFELILLFYFRISADRFVTTRNLLLTSVFLIFTSNLLFSVNENMRLLWYVIFLIVAQALGGARVRNWAAFLTALVFVLYLLQPYVEVTLSSTDILSSVLLLTLSIIMFIFYDITITHISEQLQKSRQDALHLAGVKSRFLSTMSHEIRTPMHGIIGYTDLLLQDEQEARKREYLGYIRSSGKVLLGLINDILDFSRLDHGHMPLERRCLVLRDELKTLSFFELEAKANQLDYRVTIAPSTPGTISGDSLRLIQILNNLLSNAIKFTPVGGHVELRVYPTDDGQRLTFEIEDNGVGIAQEQQAAIFAPFAQADEGSARKFGGAGLGLSITKHLVELMDGQIDFTSTPGQGSCFYFSIPCLPCETPAVMATAPVRLESQGQALSILVAEDEPISRLLIADMLGRMGHTTTVVENGADALAQLGCAHFDIVLMDISMPVMDGVEATRRLRTVGNAVPIIALTANALAEEKARYLQAGFNLCLTKPVDLETLKAVLEDYCRR